MGSKAILGALLFTCCSARLNRISSACFWGGAGTTDSVYSCEGREGSVFQMAPLSSLNLGLLLPNSCLVTCDAITILAATVCGVILLPYRPPGTSAGYAQRVHSFSVAKADIFAACESSEAQEQWAGKTSSSLSPKSIYEAPTVCVPSLLWRCLAPPPLITYLACAGCSGKEAQSPFSRSFKSSGWRNTCGPPRYCKGHCGAQLPSC